MKKCTQCGKPAMYETKGHLLCLDCYYKLQSINQQQTINYMVERNLLVEQMEATAGLYGLFPKYQIPQPSPIISHNFNINNSTVGALNSGYIENMNVNLKQIEKDGNHELSNLINEFTDKVISEDISNEIKNEVLEQLDFLLNQLAGKEPPKKSLIKSVLKSIPLLIPNIESLVNIWDIISNKISILIK